MIKTCAPCISSHKCGIRRSDSSVFPAGQTNPCHSRSALSPNRRRANAGSRWSRARSAFLNKTGVELLMESGAGVAAGFPDSEYTEKGVRTACPRRGLRRRRRAAAGAQSRAPIPRPARRTWPACAAARPSSASAKPLTALDAARALAERGVTFLAMELMPRITRAQSMDALSSMATIAGYKAVLIAADSLPRMFPMLMTAAGTVAPARVLVIGAGVAGLQAIATARRLGAVVSGYDIRAAVKEQIESLGARFVVLDVETARRRGQGRLRQGHGRGVLSPAARAARRRAGRTERGDHHRRGARQEGADPDHRARWSRRMAPGSVIVDIAAERGGNCELTRAGRSRGRQTACASSGRSTCPRPSRTTPARCTPRTSPLS